MIRALTAAVLALALSGCSPGAALSLLAGGGPKVAANVQAGKTNTQTIGVTNTAEQTLTRPTARSIEQSTGRTGLRADRVEAVHVTNTSPWLIGILMLLAGFVIPSPAEIGRMITGVFRRSPSQPA